MSIVNSFVYYFKFADYLKRRRHVIVNYTGSAHNARIYKNRSSLVQYAQLFFTVHYCK